MAEVVIGPAEALQAGQMMHVELDGEQVLVCNIDGQLHAVEGTCPHRGAQLAQGSLHGPVIVCPWHEWAYDVTTGQGISNPVSCLRTYEVRVEDGKLIVSG